MILINHTKVKSEVKEFKAGQVELMIPEHDITVQFC